MGGGALSVLVAPLLAACKTGGDDGGSSHEGSHGGGIVTVKMGGPGGELVFAPDRVRIRIGETVEWLVESAGHSATAYDPRNHEGYGSRIPEGAEPWNSGLLGAKGERFRHTFSVAGVYHYYCIPHEGAGMVGAIVVGSPVEGPASRPVQPEVPAAARAKLEELIAWAKTLPA